MFRAFEALMEGYSEGIWVFVVKDWSVWIGVCIIVVFYTKGSFDVKNGTCASRFDVKKRGVCKEEERRLLTFEFRDIMVPRCQVHCSKILFNTESRSAYVMYSKNAPPAPMCALVVYSMSTECTGTAIILYALNEHTCLFTVHMLCAVILYTLRAQRHEECM